MSALPDGMANGPSRSEAFSKDAQVWERPWSLEEIRQHSANWSLAADSGLFLCLQDFSQRMLSKTHEIEKQLDSLIRDTKATDSRLHSVFNDFLMLSNTQFIENRVYDEEVEETLPKVDAPEKHPEQEKTREQKEAELIPKMQEAVSYGLKVLESAFEHLDIKAGNSDSEDEEIPDRLEAILEPKDLYVDRPLPYLIGSRAFMEQDDVGLGDLSSDEMSVDSDRDSVVDSEDDKDEIHSDDLSQEEHEARNNIQKKSSMVSFEEDDEEEEEDSDLFEKSDEDEDVAKNAVPSSFTDELAARIKGEPVARPEGDRASLTSKKKTKSRKEPNPTKPEAAEEDSDDMFKPPKMEDHYDDDDDDDDFSPFGGKSGLFSGGKGLFDDDDEGDLFSEAPKPILEEKRVADKNVKSPTQTAESLKADKKIPAGAVSIFPDNSLFGSGQSSDSEERKENGTKAALKHTATGPAGAGAGGLFDDDDDFFSAVQEKPKPKTSIDLFDDEDGDIFGGKHNAATPAQSKREVEGEKDKPPEKKMPAGAISMFGPATKSLLSEGLKKRQQSNSEDSEKSEEVAPPADVGKGPAKPTEKPLSTSLFSDDEEPQLFPGITKRQSKPEPTHMGKTNKSPLSLFDDEEEEDLFAPAAKSKGKPSQAKVSVPQPTKATSSFLFSDDEDQWIYSKSSSSKADAQTGGIKTSASAPSNLPSTKITQNSSLFNDKGDGDDDDDLFAQTKTSSQKKPQRVALLFEDDGDDEGKESLFDDKPTFTTNTGAPSKTPVASSQSPLKSEEVLAFESPAKNKPQVQPKPAEKKPDPLPTLPSQESAEIRKKPAGAVSLFGGIDVLSSKQQTKGPLDDDDDDDQDDIFLSKGSPPPMFNTEEKKEEKGKTKTVSLFDEDEEDESDWNDPIFTASKPTAGKTAKPAEEQQQKKSTGVFQDEELLFSQTQQKDNDPDVDLFAAATKTESSKVSSVKPVAPNLFSDDDEDDIFGSVKATAPPPKVAKKPSKPLEKAPLASPDPVSEIQKPATSPVKPKDSSSRIGKLQASLMINPAALLPGAVSSMSGTLSSSSGVSSSSLSPSPASTPIGGHEESREGVSFDTPVQVSTLQSAHKDRAKGSALRRPQSRAARQQAAKKSMGDTDQSQGDVFGQNLSVSSLVLPPPSKSSLSPISATPPDSSEVSSSPMLSPSQPSSSHSSSRPSELSLPVSTNAGMKDSSKDGSSTKTQPPLEEDDIFGSDSLFGPKTVANKPPPRGTTKPSDQQVSSGAGLKDKDPSTLPSIFDDHTDDLFRDVKPQSATKKAKALPFMEDDDEDLFGLNSSATATSKTNKDIKNGSSFSKQDIFQDEAATVPKVDKKLKEKSVDAALFDSVDIFADLTDTFKPRQKSKLKGETKSIFDDDMDDIFTTSTAKPVQKAPDKSKKTPPAKETSTAPETSNIFDDPLNALGGK